MWAAAIIIVAQGCIIALMLVLVRTFGAYTKALVAAHQSNTVLYQQTVKILDYANTLLREENVA